MTPTSAYRPVIEIAATRLCSIFFSFFMVLEFDNLACQYQENFLCYVLDSQLTN